MKKKRLGLIASVQGQMFTRGDDTTPDTVGSPQWRSWLMDGQRFSVDLGYIRYSVRRERVGNGTYFYAYKRISGKLVKRYAGMETALGLPRLIEIGQWFARASECKSEGTVMA